MNAPTYSSSSSSTSIASSSSQQSPSHQAVVQPAPAQIRAPSTDVFLKDFSLVAEAAKRAQVAVMRLVLVLLTENSTENSPSLARQKDARASHILGQPNPPERHLATDDISGRLQRRLHHLGGKGPARQHVAGEVPGAQVSR
ncbi:hypothetical protein G7046_g10131 [Stylonectria norvegica]|nr:hypothetical protein G7046_g10131 [Stylonectria norvegica]